MCVTPEIVEKAEKAPGTWFELDEYGHSFAAQKNGGQFIYGMRFSNGRVYRYGIYTAPTESYEDFWKNAEIP